MTPFALFHVNYHLFRRVRFMVQSVMYFVSIFRDKRMFDKSGNPVFRKRSIFGKLKPHSHEREQTASLPPEVVVNGPFLVKIIRSYLLYPLSFTCGNKTPMHQPIPVQHKYLNYCL
jgi:hypothetical protein